MSALDLNSSGGKLSIDLVTELGAHRHRAGASQIAETAELARILRSATLLDIKSLTRDVANRRERLQIATQFAYRHVNGFKKITLFQTSSCRLRLHLWDPHVQRAENTHSHRWGFASRVLVGSASETRFTLASGDPNANEYGYSRPTGSLRGELVPIRRVALRQDDDFLHDEADVYSMATSDIHRVNDFDNASTLVTLVLTGASREPGSRVYSDLTSRPLPDKPDPGMTLDETALALQSFLKILG